MLALYIVAGIVLLILLVFSIPVDMAFNVGGPGAGRSRMRVGWLFGLLGKEFGRSGKRRIEQVGKDPADRRLAHIVVAPVELDGIEEPKERASKRKKKKRSTKPFLSLLMTKGVARGLLKMSRRILNGVRVRHLDARLRIGLDDPAATGILYSALWPVLVPPTYNSLAKVRMELSFEEPVLDLTARGRIRVLPIQMVWSVLLFTLSPAGLRAMKRMVMQR
jgi:hypothetical protein